MTIETPAYLVGNFTVTDGAMMADYGRQAGPLVRKHGGRMVVSSQTLAPVEGQAEPTLVIIQFPSLDQAEAFYHSPEYAPIRQLRIQATAGGFVALVPGLSIHL